MSKTHPIVNEEWLDKFIPSPEEWATYTNEEKKQRMDILRKKVEAHQTEAAKHMLRSKHLSRGMLKLLGF